MMLRAAFASILVLTILALSAADGAAQQGKRQDGGRDRQMSQEERQRMRDDVRATPIASARTARNRADSNGRRGRSRCRPKSAAGCVATSRTRTGI